MIEIGVLRNNMKLDYQLFPDKMKGFEAYDIEVVKGKGIITPVNINCPLCGRLGVKEFKGYFVCASCVRECKKLTKNRRKTNARKQ